MSSVPGITAAMPANALRWLPDSTSRGHPQGRSPVDERPVRGTDELQSDLGELVALAAHEGLELRVEALPESGVVQIRLVEPGTERVVREFPPEGLVEALAQLRERVTDDA